MCEEEDNPWPRELLSRSLPTLTGRPKRFRRSLTKTSFSPGVSTGRFVPPKSTLVLFFLAKVDITNDSRDLACWEWFVVWWSRFYSMLYL